MFMSNDELYDLTKKKHKSKAVKYLLDHQIPHEVGGDGWPKVSKTYMEQRMGVAKPKSIRPTEPNFGAFQIIRGRKNGKTSN